MVREVEVAEAKDDRQRELAGAYAGLRPGQWAAFPSRGMMDAPPCWAASAGRRDAGLSRARIDVRDSTVIWSDFEGPGAESYETMGRFIFRREQYEAAVAAILPRRA